MKNSFLTNCQFLFDIFDSRTGLSFNLIYYKTPFLYIVILLILGIELQSAYHFDFNSIVVFLFLILTLTWGIGKQEVFSKYQPVGFMVAFILSGCLLMSSSKTFKSNNLSSSFLVHVTETSSKGKIWKKAIATKKATILEDSIARCEEKILLYFESDKIETGDWLLISSNLKPIKNKNNPGEFDSERYWRLKGIEKMSFVGENQFLFMDNRRENWWEKQLIGLREYFSTILADFLTGDELSVAKALMLGDKGALSKDLKMSFGKAGAMHVLAVSGLHVGIILAILMFVFRQFPKWISKRNALLFSLVIIWLYAGITGLSPSVIRATIMFSLISLSIVFGRKNNSINALFFSAFIMILWDPLIIYDLGFQLSYLAMIGIFSFYPFLSSIFQFKNKWLQKIWEGTAIGIAAQLTTFPIVLYYFHQFHNYFAITNLGMMIFAGLILGIGLFLFSFHWLPFVGKITGLIFLFSLSIMIYFVEFIEQLPGAVALGFKLRPEMVIFLYMLLILFYFFNRNRIVLWSTVLISSLSFIYLQVVRYENMNKSEFIIFNSNETIIGLKNKDKILCFYEDRNHGLKKAKYLMEAYSKIYPGEINYQKIKEGVSCIEFDEHKVKFCYSIDGIRINVDGYPIVLRSNYKMRYEKEDFIIDSPYLMDNPNNYNLLNGAFSLDLKLNP